MKAYKALKLIMVFFGLLGVRAALAHPGHEHSQGIGERWLHAVQTEWLAPLLVLVLIAGYLFVKKAGKE